MSREYAAITPLLIGCPQSLCSHSEQPNLASNIPTDIIHYVTSASGHSFQAVCHELLAPFIPMLINARTMGEVDGAGADLYRLNEATGDFEWAIQCKGFELDFGESQLTQCLKSIDSFQKAARATEKYRLVINRPIKDAVLRTRLNQKLSELETSGKALSAEAWPLDQFLIWLGNAARQWISERIVERGRALKADYSEAMDWRFYIEDVPFSRDSGQTKNGLIFTLEEEALHWSEIDATRDPSLAGRIFVVSEFGFGKTSLLLTLFERLEQTHLLPIFAPLTQFGMDALNEKVLAGSIFETLITESDAPRSEIVRKILREGVVSVLRRERSAVLLVDGIDEHPLCHNTDGLAHFLNSLANFPGYCVMTVRKEFWDERYGNFESAFRQSKNWNKRRAVVLLSEWQHHQIQEFIAELEKFDEYHRSEGFRQFSGIIKRRTHTAYYGDIPMRPLFLRMLADDAAEGVIERENLAVLYHRYFIRKLDLDRFNLAKTPGTGRRLPLNDSDANARAYILIDVLTDIAKKMILAYSEEEGSLELLPTIQESELLELLNDRKVQIANVLELLTHSVLVPDGPRRNSDIKLRFAHKSFQEWFTARALRREPWWIENLRHPLLVRRFLTEIVDAKDRVP